MKIETSISSIRSQAGLEPGVTSAADVRGGEERSDYGAHSGAQQVLRAVVSRLDSLNARLGDITVAANEVARLQGAAISEDTDGSPVSGQGFKARHAENRKTLLAVERVLDKAQASKVAGHVVRAELSKLSLLDGGDVPGGGALSRRFADETVELLRGLPGGPRDVRGNARSSGDFFEQLTGMIDDIKDDYLAVYEEMLSKYSAFYKDFNESIMGKMGRYVDNDTASSNIWLRTKEMKEDIVALIDKYSSEPEGVYYRSSSRVEALKWAEAMGLPDSCVQSSKSGGFVVMIDLSVLKKMRDQLPEINNAPFWTSFANSAAFQAWQTGFNSLESDLKNQLQLFTTKYSNANSYHENFNKIFSSQLVQFAEMLKQMTSSFA
ncbi:IpaD/SipD/SspD family type III secretion system needle tip protein [Pseudomonas chlororaphis]|uniref:IpaD/SipD/SspD family type III secretion system needle tip protein n=1 Tax=Pseudomonas chlororaphis TaxID=587753 RepID=UPI0030D2FA93